MSQPNILLIVADQLRWDWLSCTGTVGPETPVLDALAARGLRFTTSATTSAMCAPARIGMATGLLPHRLGALTNNAYLPARVPTWYQQLRDYDYRVGLVGKIDLAKPDRHNGLRGDRPSAFRWGFTHPIEAEGKFHAGTSSTPIGPYTAWLEERGLLEGFFADYINRYPDLYVGRDGDGLARSSVLPEDAFEDVWIGEQAARWILDIPADFPWFLQVGFVGPHDPYDPPAAWAERYAERPVADPAPVTSDVPRRVAGLQFNLCPDQVRLARRQYTAAMAIIDEQIGRLIEAVEAAGCADDTIVLFTADHGDMLGDKGIFQKHVAYEGAMRIPLIAAGPGIVEGAVSDALVELPDIGQTILELAGGQAMTDVDARSFHPVLTDPTTPHRDDLVCLEQEYQALRTARFKFINTHGSRSELYDLDEDPLETTNIVNERPDVAASLRASLNTRLQEGRWMR